MTKPSSNRGPGKLRTLDVRWLVAEGHEPFGKIMEAVADLGPHDGLEIISPFLPSPLIERLQSDGFRAMPERRSDGAWQTRFVRE
jgi:hypothetical protein